MAKRIKSLWKKIDSKYAIIVAIFIVVNIFFLKNIVNAKYGYFNEYNNVFNIILAVVIVLEILYAFFLKNVIKKFSIEKIFLVIAIPLGLLYMLFIPINGTPDEYAHILRSYEISEGALISDKNENGVGNELPSSIDEVGNQLGNVLSLKYDDLVKTLNIEQGSEEKFYEFHTSAVYSAFSYIPQSVGILVGRGLKLPMILQLYSGRLFNFITWVLCIYFCIKKSINSKKLLFLIALLPMCFQLSISLAPDAMTIAVAMAIFTFTEYSIFNKNKKLTKKEYGLMWALSILIAMLKIVYIPICLLFLLIPKERFGSKKKKIINLLLLYFVTVLTNLLWMYLCFGFIGQSNPGVNAVEQIKFILKSPISYACILFDSIVNNFDNHFFEMLGSNLGWLNIGVNRLYLFVYFLIICYISVFDSKKEITNKKFKLIYNILNLFVIITVIVLIFTSLYVQWNAVANTTISGVQGRYYLPILIMLLYLLNIFKAKTKDNIDTNMEYIYLFCIFVNIYTLMVLFVHHL